jgi:hypothetical protein
MSDKLLSKLTALQQCTAPAVTMFDGLASFAADSQGPDTCILFITVHIMSGW